MWFRNTSPLTFTRLLDDPNTIADALQLYIGGFSDAAKDIIDKFDFGIQIERLRRANVLYQVVGKFADVDLHPVRIAVLRLKNPVQEKLQIFERLAVVANQGLAFGRKNLELTTTLCFDLLDICDEA